MRILLPSLCLFLMVGCASYPKKKGFEAIASVQKETLNPYFSDVSKDYVYKANIEAFDKSFGGVFIVKKLGDAHHRVAFTTEMGNTLFDFTFKGEDFKVNRILKEMDRKLLINILKRDFKALIVEHPPVLRTFRNAEDVVAETEILSKKHYFYQSDGELYKTVRVGNGKEKVVFLYSDIADNLARDIQILHQNLDLEIHLTALK